MMMLIKSVPSNVVVEVAAVVVVAAAIREAVEIAAI